MNIPLEVKGCFYIGGQGEGHLGFARYMNHTEFTLTRSRMSFVVSSLMR